MPFENYRDESIIWAHPNAIWSRGKKKASLNNWKETATGQNIPRAQRSVSLCPLPSNGRCHIQVNVKNTEQELSSSGVLQILSHFCWWAVRVRWASSPASSDSFSHVTDSCSRCRKSLNFDGLQHQWINGTGKNRLRGRRNDAKSFEIIQWILIRKLGLFFSSWHLQAAFNSQVSMNTHYPKDPVMTVQPSFYVSCSEHSKMKESPQPAPKAKAGKLFQ